MLQMIIYNMIILIYNKIYKKMEILLKMKMTRHNIMDRSRILIPITQNKKFIMMK